MAPKAAPRGGGSGAPPGARPRGPQPPRSQARSGTPTPTPGSAGAGRGKPPASVWRSQVSSEGMLSPLPRRAGPGPPAPAHSPAEGQRVTWSKHHARVRPGAAGRAGGGERAGAGGGVAGPPAPWTAPSLGASRWQEASPAAAAGRGLPPQCTAPAARGGGGPGLGALLGPSPAAHASPAQGASASTPSAWRSSGRKGKAGEGLAALPSGGKLIAPH